MEKLDQTYLKNQLKEILIFWFSEEVKGLWFNKNEIFDQKITSKYLDIYNKLANIENNILINYFYNDEKNSENILALVILFDQFPRNMFRNKAISFQTDEKALFLTKFAIRNELDRKLEKFEYRQFLYMPLMHSENLEDQKLSVELFSSDHITLEFAKRHKEIIEKFGRFPHRNKILGRLSTENELYFLTQPNSSF